jgi:hypothetical protein
VHDTATQEAETGRRKSYYNHCILLVSPKKSGVDRPPKGASCIFHEDPNMTANAYCSAETIITSYEGRNSEVTVLTLWFAKKTLIG